MKKRKSLLILVICVFVISAVLPFFKAPFFYDIMITIFLWAGLASSWNIISGFTGRLSLGHSAFFGIGAYSSTILFIKLGLSPWLGMFFGAMLAGILAAIIEMGTAHLVGIYFSLSTFALSQLIEIIARGWRELTYGTAGLTIPFEPSFMSIIFQHKLSYVYFSFGYLIFVLVISFLILSSRFGYFLRAIRDNEEAAQSIGIHSKVYRVWASFISGFLMAIGGTVYAQYILLIDPDSVLSWNTSVQVALMSIIGGMGTIIGPVIGAVLMVPLQKLLQAWFSGTVGGLDLIIYGPFLIVMVLLMPQGIVPFLKKRFPGFTGKKASKISKSSKTPS